VANILIVEDDVDIAQGIAEFLERKGHCLDFAYNGKQALNLIDQNHYDLILLDINLPFVDGLDVSRTLLLDKLTRIPVIMMSARGETSDILAGFDSGAWDYLVKPFSFVELSARIDVGLAKSINSNQKSMEYQGATLDENALTFEFKQRKIQLHQVGFDILKILIQRAPDAVKSQLIHQQIWGERTPDSDPLRSHIYKLRKQLFKHFDSEFIKTIKSVGYCFDIEKSKK